jgi:hypothetical protein
VEVGIMWTNGLRWLRCNEEVCARTRYANQVGTDAGSNLHGGSQTLHLFCLYAWSQGRPSVDGIMTGNRSLWAADC